MLEYVLWSIEEEKLREKHIGVNMVTELKDKKKIRVLHIVSNVSKRSGIMSFIMNYGRNLADDITFDFLYYEEREVDYKEEIDLLEGCVYKSPSPMSIRSFSSFINDFCKRNCNKYDVVHLHDPFLVCFYYMLKKRLGAKSFVVHAHNTRFSDKKINELRNRLFALPCRWVPDFQFACSDMAGKAIFGKKYKGYVVNNAIQVKKFLNNSPKRDMQRKKLGVESNFVVGHIGNFIQQKNQSFIIDVFFHVLKKQPNAVLLMIGDGNTRAEIEAKCVELGIRNQVQFLGVRNDVNEIICAFDRFLFPSLYEGLGIALIEAQSAGIPCIYSTVIPPETNILRNNNKILSLQQSPQEWADAVLDEKITVQYGVEQKIRNAGFDIETEAERLKNNYQIMVRDTK